MSRQRLQPSLGETSYTPCPRCHGTGHIRGAESSALHILRILQEEAMKENTGALHVQLPVDVATFLLNEKRVDIHTLETRLKVNVVLIPNIHLETPHYAITRLRHDELNLRDAAEPSYKLVALPEAEPIYQTAQEAAPARQVAAVKSIAPPPQPAPAARPAGAAQPQPETGLFERIFGWFKQRGEEAPAAKAAPAAEPAPALTRGARPSERRDRKPGQRRGRDTGRGEASPNESREPREPRQATPRPSEGRAETRGGESAKPARPPRQPKPRPEAEAAPQGAGPVEAPLEAVSEEKRESRSRRGRGNRRPREARPENEAGTGERAAQTGNDVAAAPAGFHAIIEIAGAPKTAPAAVAPAQQALQLETAAPVTASPAVILAELATGTANLNQVETQAAAVSTPETSEAGRPRRRRRPVIKTETEPVSLMQVETTSVPVATAGETTAPAAPHPTRRRSRPQVPPPQEPLVQVETQAK
jgi:ribonuclease E